MPLTPPAVTQTPTGDVPESDKDAHPDHFEPGGAFAPFVVFCTQNVAVALYGIQDDFRPKAIPVARDFATQHIQFV